MIEWFLSTVTSLLLICGALHLYRSFKNTFGRRYLVILDEGVVICGGRTQSRLLKAGVVKKTVAI